MFYLKFYMFTALLGGKRFIQSLFSKKIVKVIRKLLIQTLRSSLFLFVSFHFPSRIHCLYQYLLKLYHRLIEKEGQEKYVCIAANNLALMQVVSSIFGFFCIQFELSKSKRTDLALFSLWRILEVAIGLKANVACYEKDYEHPILGDTRLPAILFALSCGMVVFAHVTNPNALKSLEKTVVKHVLA